MAEASAAARGGRVGRVRHSAQGRDCDFGGSLAHSTTGMMMMMMMMMMMVTRFLRSLRR